MRSIAALLSECSRVASALSRGTRRSMPRYLRFACARESLEGSSDTLDCTSLATLSPSTISMSAGSCGLPSSAVSRAVVREPLRAACLLKRSASIRSYKVPFNWAGGVFFPDSSRNRSMPSRTASVAADSRKVAFAPTSLQTEAAISSCCLFFFFAMTCHQRGKQENPRTSLLRLPPIFCRTPCRFVAHEEILSEFFDGMSSYALVFPISFYLLIPSC